MKANLRCRFPNRTGLSTSLIDPLIIFFSCYRTPASQLNCFRITYAPCVAWLFVLIFLATSSSSLHTCAAA